MMRNMPEPDAPTDLRTRKRLAMRQGISTAATRLFLEKGFDVVTVDEIAAAADVGRMTVFNHFPRKEDMFFDREDEGIVMLREALRQRDPQTTPVEALRLLAHRLVKEGSPYVEFSEASQGYVRTIEGSETLKARARAIRDEVATALSAALAESVKKKPGDRSALLAAQLLVATWSVALVQAHQTYALTLDAKKARAAFLAIVEKGSIGVKAAVEGTPFA